MELKWSRALLSLEGRTTGRESREIRSLAAEAEAEVTARTPIDLPVLAYYGTGRLWLQKRDRSERRERLESRLQGYAACLEPASDQTLLEAWMRWREQVRLQEIAGGVSADAVASPHLDAVEQAACACVPGARRFRYDFRHRELRFSLTSGEELPFALLSDGYRNLLAMAADIAWRAVMLNPHRGREAARVCEGVVLVDEVDLHLHPSWQRTVIPSLRAAFPRVQFVATTHSPQVVSSAPGASIRLLDGAGGVRRIAHSEGRDSNALLEDIFGTRHRPNEVDARIARLFTLIDRADFSEARRELAWLEGLVGPDDADVVRARWLLDQEDTAA